MDLSRVAAPQGTDLLLPWRTAMDRGVVAARQGQCLMAMVSYQQALAIARRLLGAPRS